VKIKNLLVHVDPGVRSAVRIGIAAAIAKRHGARLVGLFAQTAEAHRVGIVPVWPTEEYVRAAEESRAAFVRAAAEAGVERAEWQDANRGGDQEVVRSVVEAARGYDVVVVGEPAEGERVVPEDLIEEVIRDSGRPVLVVPGAGHFDTIGRRPLLAWTGSREAARAINDSLPLLEQDAAATVLSIGSTALPSEASIDPILKHLACHGVRAKSERIVAGEEGKLDHLLSQAAEHGSDLLVLGAFGGHSSPLHGRGAWTRQLLSQITLPTLVSH
jgi:nucleotide-binding universal stress UspA family protein